MHADCVHADFVHADCVHAGCVHAGCVHADCVHADCLPPYLVFCLQAFSQGAVVPERNGRMNSIPSAVRTAYANCLCELLMRTVV